MSSAVPKFGFAVEDVVRDGRITLAEIDELNQWMSNDAAGRYRFEREQLIFFLISCDRDVEFTKRTIEQYVRIKRDAPNLFANRNVFLPPLQKQLQVVEFSIFPERTDDGCIIIYHKLFDTTYYRYVMEDSMKLLFMTLESAMYDDPPTGLIVLGDMKGIGLMHLTKIRLNLFKTFFAYLQEALPIKLKVIHLLNCVTFIDKCLAIIKPFLKREVFELIQFHPSNIDYELFYERWIPKKCLPSDYGGDLPSARELHARNTERLEAMGEFFAAEEAQRFGAGN